MNLAALETMEDELRNLERQLSDPDVIADQNRFRDVSKRHAELSTAVARYSEYKAALQDVEEARALLEETADEEERQFYQEELRAAEARTETTHAALIEALIPRDEADEKNAIMEVRAGTGGDEAALFAGDLFGMYSAFAEQRNWKVEVLDSSPSDLGGVKEIVFAVSGKGAYGELKSESGVHRVQRVPVTESQGRIHTSAATVAVLPEAEQVDVELDLGDCEIQTFKASGAGGQHVQKNDTAVRVRHKPTGIVVNCQNERSQHQNKEQALRILRSKLLDLELERRQREEAEARRQQVKSGDRSEKIRTYNFPQDRLTDHRIGLDLHNLPGVMDGDLDRLIDALRNTYEAERLSELAEGSNG
jgi:peptide chain release factor 1